LTSVNSTLPPGGWLVNLAMRCARRQRQQHTQFELVVIRNPWVGIHPEYTTSIKKRGESIACPAFFATSPQ
jgi:hypothetical protein